MRRYVPELDGLRAIAAVLVILFHTPPDGPFHGGFIGVDIFFVLSAFLITSILVDEQDRTGTLRLGQFYWRRSVRLMPALLLLLAVYLLVAPILKPDYPHWRDALIAGLYVSNYAYIAAQVPAALGHTWSLAAEEQFYLLWPVVVLFLLRTKRPVLILGAGWAGLSLLRLNTDNPLVAYYGLATHGTGLVLGATLFFLLREGKLTLRPFHAFVAIGILAVLSFEAQMALSPLPIAVAEFATAIIIGTVMTNPGSLPLLASRPLVGLGKLSYGLYLWHYPISFLVQEFGGFWSNFAIIFALSLGLASLSYMTVENWARKFRGGLKSDTASRRLARSADSSFARPSALLDCPASADSPLTAKRRRKGGFPAAE